MNVIEKNNNEQNKNNKERNRKPDIDKKQSKWTIKIFEWESIINKMNHYMKFMKGDSDRHINDINHHLQRFSVHIVNKYFNGTMDLNYAPSFEFFSIWEYLYQYLLEMNASLKYKKNIIDAFMILLSSYFDDENHPKVTRLRMLKKVVRNMPTTTTLTKSEKENGKQSTIQKK